MKRMLLLSVLLGMALVCKGADAEFVVNGSFESGDAVPATGWGTFGTLADDWTYVSGDGAVRTQGGSGDPWYGRVADDGTIFVGIKSNPGTVSVMEQQLSGLVIGASYAVNFSANLDAYSGTESSNLKVYIGSTLIYDVNMGRYGWYRTGDTWETQSYVANSVDGYEPVLRFEHTNDAGNSNGHYMLFDAVSVYGPEAGNVPGALSLPIVEQPNQHEYAQFGYDPDYLPNAVGFDTKNRAYIRSRSGDPSDTGYVQVYVDGVWEQRDFTAAVIAKYPTFEGYEKVQGFEGDRMVTDADGDLYTKMIIRLAGSEYKNILLYSRDNGLNWQVYELPGGRYDMEYYVGHNTLKNPPALCYFYKTSDNPYEEGGNNYVAVLQPMKSEGGLVFQSPVQLTQKGLYLTRHSGGSSFAVSTDEGTFVVWAETDPNNTGEGAPTYVAKYDAELNQLVGDPNQFIGYSQPINDRHTTPAIAVDSNGYLHVVTGAHATPCYYTRSLTPYSIEGGWTEMVSVYDKGWAESVGGVEEGQLTYPAMLIDLNDQIHLVVRSWRKNTDSYFGGDVMAALLYLRKPAMGDWSGEGQLLVVPPFSGYSIYYHKLSMDKLGNLFLFYEYLSADGTYVYPDPQDYSQDYYPAVMMSPNGGLDWKLAENSDFDNPIPCPMQYLDGDFNQDCYVDMKDLTILVDEWFGCNDLGNEACWE